MPIKQEARSIAIATALGPDVLAVRSFTLQEQMSRLFQIEVELTSHDGKIDLDAVVGHPATLRLDSGKDDERFFNGIVSRLVQLSTETKFAPAAYRATIVPWLWFLTRTSDCYIFQELSVPDIIKD